MNINHVYWCARGYTQLLAIISVVALLLSTISQPKIEAPSPLDAPLSFLPFLLLSIVLLLPYRWSVHGTYYHIRLGLYLAASLWLAYLAITSAWTFRTEAADLFVSLVLVTLAVCAPASILLYKRLHQPQVLDSIKTTTK